MIKIAISEAALDAIAQTPLRGTVNVEPEANERANAQLYQRLCWLTHGGIPESGRC